MKIIILIVLCFSITLASKVSKTVLDLNPKHLTQIVAKRFEKGCFNLNELDSGEDGELTSLLRHELQENGVFDGYQDSKFNVLVSSAIKASSKSHVQDKVSNKSSDVNANTNGDMKLDLFGKCTPDQDIGGIVLNYTLKSNVKTENASIDVTENIGFGYFLKVQRILAADVEHELGFIAPDEVAGLHVIRALGSSVIKQTVSTKDYSRQYVQKSAGQALVVGVKSDADDNCRDTVKVLATGGSKTSITTTVKGKKYAYTIGSVDSSISVIKKD